MLISMAYIDQILPVSSVMEAVDRFNVALETSYWCNRRKTSEIYRQLPTDQ